MHHWCMNIWAQYQRGGGRWDVRSASCRPRDADMRADIYFQPENEKTERVSTRELTQNDLTPSLSDYKLPLA